jgi:hypothetical protein
MPVSRLARHGSARGNAPAMGAAPRRGCAARRPAVLQIPDERGRLRNRLLRQRSQRESARYHSDGGNGQRSGWAEPRPAPPGRRARLRRPETLTDRPEHRLQPRQGGLQHANRVPGQLGASGHHPGEGQRVRRGQPGSDPLQAILSGLYRVSCHVQCATQNLVIVTIALAHASRSSTARSAVLARAVWLLTAPRLIPIAEAIWASDRSP